MSRNTCREASPIFYAKNNLVLIRVKPKELVHSVLQHRMLATASTCKPANVARMAVVLDLANNKRNSYLPNLDRRKHHFVVTSQDFEPFMLVVCKFVLLKVGTRSTVRINRINMIDHLIEHKVMRPLTLYWQIGHFEVVETRQ